MVRAAKDDVQRWGVDDEDAQACAGEDTGEVVVVPDDRLAEGEGELRFDSKDVETLDNEYREIDCPYIVNSTW